MRIALLIVAMLTFWTAPCIATDATTAWKKVLKKCARSDVIGSQQLFFGLSNSIGPGSVWTFANDRSLRLQFALADAFPDAADRERMIATNNTVSCDANSASDWNLRLGLPFSTAAMPLNADVAAVLTRAAKVSVSVTGFSVDYPKTVPWEAAFKKLEFGNPYRLELYRPGRVLAANSVRITGLKAVFSYGSDLSADVQARFSNRTFTLGTNTSPAAKPGSGGTSLGTAAGASRADPSSQPLAEAPLDPCVAGDVDAKPGTGASREAQLAGAAAVHAQVVSARQIVICTAGPSYLLAAYSRIKGGSAVGMTPTTQQRVELVPADIPIYTQVVGAEP